MTSERVAHCYCVSLFGIFPERASLLPPAVREGREPSLYIDDSALASFQQNDNGNGNGNGNGMYIVLFNLARFKIAMIGRSQL